MIPIPPKMDGKTEKNISQFTFETAKLNTVDNGILIFSVLTKNK